MKNDIQNRDDLYALVSLFYKKLLSNKEMLHFFEKFNEPETLEKHLHILVDFWDNILFYSGTYHKNAMQPHVQLHHKNPFTEKHFETWLNLFNAAIDENFEGTNSETIKARALSIATVMRLKTIHA